MAPALATNAGSVERWLLRKHPHPPCAEPDLAQRTGGWCGEGKVGGERMGTHLLAWSSAVTWPRSGHERWRSGVRGRGEVVGRYMVLSEFSFLTLSRFLLLAFPDAI